MRVLLDTHAFLWFVLNDRQLSPAARNIILLIAQAIAEQIPLVSGDKAFDVYPVQRVW